MALPLFLIGGAVVRAVAPRIVAEIIKRGGKKITQQAAKKINNLVVKELVNNLKFVLLQV